MMKSVHAVALTLVLAGGLLASGCATKKYVQKEDAKVTDRVNGVQGEVEEVQGQVKQHDTHLATHDQQIGEASRTAQEALARAQEAGKLAEGKLLYETVLTDDRVHFGFNKHELSAEAKAALDEFAEKLKADGKGVYIEVQGHTDAVGSDDYNEDLGQTRAQAVRNYLARQHQLPLHRMNVISYGELAPIADNKTAEGRAQNRRVALVVLR
ncbi:MAG TPA: OmpA family protein [Thermoanaerobaculia bacterium]|jgi:outer membrane protein OmpA-like peptidoglycan-associated protein|nr:OmpA family protein [Thermoanaerobaculia bacterium]